MINEPWRMAQVSEVIDVTDYVANGSFASLKDNVRTTSVDGYAILARLVDHNAGWSSNFSYVDEHSYRFLKKSSLVPGDIVISNVGANAGTVFRIPDLGKPMTLGPNAVLCRPLDSNILDKRYLYFHFRGPIGQHALKSIVAGSAQPKFNKTELRRLELPLPPIYEQRRIAHILGTLDDKIEINRQMNKTLDEIARTLFRSWFIDFDPVRAKMEGRQPDGMDAATAALFPDRLVDSELGLIPEGWEVMEIDEVASFVRRGISPSYADDGVLVINQKCIRDGELTLGKARRHNSPRQSTENRLIEPGDILVNSTGVGTLGRIAQVAKLSEPTIVDSHVTVVRPKLEFGSVYIGQQFFTLQPAIETMGQGSTGQTELSRRSITSIKIVVPNRAIRDSYEHIVSPLRELRQLNLEESCTLADLRDTLLPELMSLGQRVKDTQELALRA